MNPPVWPEAFALSAMLAIAAGAAAGPDQRSGSVRWRGGVEPATDLAPGGLAPAVADALIAATPPGAVRHLIVRLGGPITRPERAALQRAGVTLQAPLGEHCYFARIDGDRLQRDTLAVLALRECRRAEPAHKLHPLFDRIELPAWAVVQRDAGGAATRVAAHVLFHRDVGRADARQVVDDAGGTVITLLSAVNALVIEAAPAAIGVLAGRDEVLWIEPPLPPLSPTNAENRQATQVNTVQHVAKPPMKPVYGLDGAGIDVMLYDGGVALSDHPDFGGRVHARDNSNVSGHATHVAGTIAGDGLMSDGAHRGMAPAATLQTYGYQYQGDQIFLYDNPGDMENDYVDAIVGLGAVLANNSLGSNIGLNNWPCEIMGDYGITSAVIDSIVRGKLGGPIRVVWAVGNERDFAVCGGAYNTVAPPAGAKNPILVGAVNADDLAITDFTSWGPVDDGRLRPDIIAPGCQAGGDEGVTSTDSTQIYTTTCGTSMAAPTVTGIAALLMQDYRDRFPGRGDLWPSTLKTLLVHTAEDRGPTGPDYQTGYGLVQAADAIDFMRTGRFLEASIDQGQVYEFMIDVTLPGAPLKVTLAWDDVPGTPNVVNALVNDLDLTVSGPGGVHMPWTLQAAAPEALAERTGADHVNNLEQVVIDSAAVGVYTISVSGTNIPEGPQPFSVAASPDLVSTVITLPGGGPASLLPQSLTPIVAFVRVTGQSVVAESVLLRFRYGAGPFIDAPMADTGGDRYEAMLPSWDCDTPVDYYLMAAGSMTGIVRLPIDAPAGTLSPPIGVSQIDFEDDFEGDTGWSVANGPGLFAGGWERGIPAGTGTRGDPASDADGSGQCYLTGNLPGNNDVDGGSTTLTSPRLDASVNGPVIAYRRWFSNMQGNNPNTEVFIVEVSDDDGASWQTLETIGPTGPEVVGGWISVQHDLSKFPGFEPNKQFRVRFIADDPGPGSIVEAGIDAVELAHFMCDTPPDPCPADVNDSSVVDVDDLVAVVLAWGPCAGPCPDVNADGVVDVDDLIAVIVAFGACR